MKEGDDTSLLRAIALQRDAEAFAVLFDRYREHAFNMAFKILRNPALAEDAVQEAMLSIWLSTKPMNPNNTRSWILGIVMKTSFRLGRTQKRSAKREERIAMEQSRPEPNAAEEAENKELITVLRSQIDQLPVLERTLLACYSTSMPQREIAKMVGVSQMTVSNKIQSTLARLRSILTGAGVAAVVSLLTKDNVFEAMATGQECPPGMTERLIERITRVESNAANSRGTTGARRTPWISFVAGFSFFAIAAGVVWWATNVQQQVLNTTSSAPVAARVPPPSVATAEAGHVPYSRTWNFNTRDQADEFKVVDGSWHWLPAGGSNGSGCMEIDDSKFVLVLDVPRLPVLVTFRASIVSKQPQSAALGVLWEKYRFAGYFQNVGREAFVQPLAWTNVRIYGTDRALDCWIDQERFQLCAADRVPGSPLRLGFKGQRRIDDLTIQEIGPNDTTDVNAYISAVEKIDSAHRTGSVLLQDVKGSDPTKPVRIQFIEMPANPAKIEP